MTGRPLRRAASREVEQPRFLRAGADDAIVVKPRGLSVDLSGANAADALLGWVRRELRVPEAWLPHRLDRIARGIVMVALTREAAAFHGGMIAARRWHKHYLVRVAWAAGRRDGADGRADRDWDALLGRHMVYLRERGRRAEVVRSGGQPSALEVLAWADDPSRPGHAHLVVRLETGRFHQIRATMAHLGAPIAGDELYDPQAAERGAAPYLEHALLWHPLFEPGVVAGHAAMELAFDPDDPHREPVAPALRAALVTLAATPPASV